MSAELVQTCRHVLQHLQQHVLSFIDELGALNHQLPQAQVAVEHCADQPAFEMPLNGLNLHERGKQSCSGTKHTNHSNIQEKGIKATFKSV